MQLVSVETRRYDKTTILYDKTTIPFHRTTAILVAFQWIGATPRHGRP